MGSGNSNGSVTVRLIEVVVDLQQGLGRRTTATEQRMLGISHTCLVLRPGFATPACPLPLAPEFEQHRMFCRTAVVDTTVTEDETYGYAGGNRGAWGAQWQVAD